MAGGVSSLNVSAAGAVVLYEAARQRRERQFWSTELAQKLLLPRAVVASGAEKAERPRFMKGFPHFSVREGCPGSRFWDLGNHKAGFFRLALSFR
jgi:hypothetical protein